jgi:hypothetical protein
MLAPTGLFGQGEHLDERLGVRIHVLLGLRLALLPHLGVSLAEGNGVLSRFSEHVSVNLAALIHPPDLIGNAVNGLQHVFYDWHFVTLGHFGDLALKNRQCVCMYNNVVIDGSMVTLPHFPGVAELLHVPRRAISALGNSSFEYLGNSRLFSDTDLAELLDAQLDIHLDLKCFVV